jgi:hypothetical protein
VESARSIQIKLPHDCAVVMRPGREPRLLLARRAHGIPYPCVRVAAGWEAREGQLPVTVLHVLIGSRLRSGHGAVGQPFSATGTAAFARSIVACHVAGQPERQTEQGRWLSVPAPMDGRPDVHHPGASARGGQPALALAVPVWKGPRALRERRVEAVQGHSCLPPSHFSLAPVQFIQKLISTYSNDKLLRSKFSSPQRVSIFPVSPCEFFGHVLACGYALILESGGRSAIPLAPTRAERRAD